MTRRRGDGTIYKRRDGRVEAAVYLRTASGIRKRVRFYAATYDEARMILAEAIAKADRGQVVPDRSWRIGEYLDYWLANVARPKVRPRTYQLYESTVRLHLKPVLGSKYLAKLSVPELQLFFNAAREGGATPRTIHLMRTVLSSALGRAMKEDLTVRNVARLVDLPAWHRKETSPWTGDQARAFLAAARTDALYLGFLLLTVYGLRRGEVLGLRWVDIDYDRAEIHVRQQVQRYDGALQLGPVKTDAGQRDLPLLAAIGDALADYRAGKADESIGTSDLVFTTSHGQPVEPGNLLRSFHRICESIEVPRITLHYVRHTAATLLKDLGVPARDAQAILGHAHITTTQQLYQHSSSAQQRQAIDGVGQALLGRLGLCC